MREITPTMRRPDETLVTSTLGVTRREFLTRASACVYVVALAGAVDACSPAVPAAEQPTQGGAGRGGATPPLNSVTTTPVVATDGAAPTVAEMPRRGGTLRYAHVGDYATVEGQTVSPPTFDILWGVWDRLTAYDKSMQPQPMLAESWEISPDSTQIKFNLRHGVQFHTGRELTADDVKWCLQRLQDPKVTTTLRGGAQVMVGLDTPDRYTVIVKASRPWPDAFDFFEYVNIVDPITLQAGGPTKPTGTGPFVLAEYAQGDHIRLVRNTNYWRSDRPYLDEVVSLVRDDQTAILELEAGAIDIFGYGLPIAGAARLQSDPRYQVLFNDTTGGFSNIVINCTVAPTNTRLVRQALNYALDRKRIADSIWHGLAKPEALPWSATSPAYDPAKSAAFGFDLDRARSLLAESGNSNISVEYQWSTSGGTDAAAMAQIYQADLAKIGVSLMLKPTEAAVHVSMLSARSFRGLATSAGSFGQMRPAVLLQGATYGPDVNNAGFKDDAYTLLVHQVLTETDPAKQLVLYSQLNDYILDQSFTMPVTQNPPHLAARANVQGMRYDAHEALVLSDVWLV